VADLNQRARSILKRRGELGPEVKVETLREVTRDDGSVAVERGERVFAPGDRVMFLKNDREIGVKNGSLATVMSVSTDSM
jgi:ATP-dependent exoDNAse (exonuclease V) alpha subunit